MKWSELIPPNIALPPSPAPQPPTKKKKKKKRSRRRKKGLLAGKSLACHNYILNHTKVFKKTNFFMQHIISRQCVHFAQKCPFLSKEQTNNENKQ